MTSKTSNIKPIVKPLDLIQSNNDLDFTEYESLFSSEILDNLPNKYYNVLSKAVKTRHIIPHPDNLLIFSTAIKIKKQQKYNIHYIKAISDVSKLILTKHNTHHIDGNIPMSLNFLSKSIEGAETKALNHNVSRDIFNTAFTKEHIGNSLDGEGCSSYSINEGINSEEVVYTNENTINKLLVDYFNTFNIEEYTTKYNIIKKNYLNKSINKNKMLKILVDHASTNKTTGNVLHTFTFDDNRLKHMMKIRDHHEAIVIDFKETYGIKYYSKNGRAYKDMSKSLRVVKEIDNILKSLHKGILYYSVSVSEACTRSYHILNSMSKLLRNSLFHDYIELDVSNMAFCSIRNQHSHLDLPYMDMYINKRDDITKMFADELYNEVQGGDLGEINRRSGLYQEIKGFVKTNTLSYLFGAKNLITYTPKTKHLVKSANKVINNPSSPIGEYMRNFHNEIVTKISSKYENKNHLSVMFMTQETEIMNKFTKIFTDSDSSLTNRIIHIHDAILVPIQPYNININDIYDIETFYKIKIKNIDLLDIIEDKIISTNEVNVVGIIEGVISKEYSKVVDIYNKVIISNKHLIEYMKDLMLFLLFLSNNKLNLIRNYNILYKDFKL